MTDTQAAIQQLAAQIRNANPGSTPVRMPLRTSERVIRRVTDGIYREPWAAIRELISNSFDADATEVVISTDAPRFKRLTIRDNGNGFTADALAAMCQSIGGSPKRTSTGAALGVTDVNDEFLSPGGRRLIGKLGIGLFAISQLSQQFRILTKVAGEQYRTVADLILIRHSEPRTKSSASKDELVSTGEIQFSKIPASDPDAHGTDIIIEQLLPGTQAEFCSRNLWELITGSSEQNASDSVQRPAYHIGYADPSSRDQYLVEPKVPWETADTAIERFRKLTEAMFMRVEEQANDRRPSLSTTFDNYLRFVWLLALGAPLDYIDCHPFDLTGSSGLRAFRLGDVKTGQAQELNLGPNETIRSRLGLAAPERGNAAEFRVAIDGLELRRPIRFTSIPASHNKLKTPLLFIGAETPNFSKYDPRRTGGDLRFEGYLLWCPRVVPVEHNGVLLRIGDASGSLFDRTFMNYQVSEQTRRDQVTSEVFIHEGLDAALNIDRETFNHSHPHYQYLAVWVHDAFKQFATRHKSIGSAMRAEEHAASHVHARSKLDEMVISAVDSWSDNQEEPVEVNFVPKSSLAIVSSLKSARSSAPARFIVDEDVILACLPERRRLGGKAKKEQDLILRQAKAIIQVLYAAGVLDSLEAQKQEKLFSDLFRIVFFKGRG